MPRRLWRLLAVILVLVGLRPAFAQDGQDASSSGEIEISCPWFGVGGAVRPGEWAGLRLGIKDTSDKQREVLVQVNIVDADGDHPLYERSMTTNPGVNQPLWVYLRLPAKFRQNDLITVQAFAAVEQASTANTDKNRPQQFAYTTGRLLGSARIKPRGLTFANEGMIGVIGAQRLGLTKYAGQGQGQGIVTGHERTEIVTGLNADSLPDRWEGLCQFDALVWHQAAPSSLPADRAQALREWVQRGGHLVVVLPRVGQTWTDEANNPLFDLTPRVRVDRREGVSIAPYRDLIVNSTDPKNHPAPKMPTSEILQILTPVDGASPDEATPILAGPPGENGARDVIAVRRLVGTGMVTMIGLDVASRWMNDHDLPDPQIFWHRILGRRGALWDTQENAQYMTAGRSQRFILREPSTTLDRGLASKINFDTSAARGVMLGFVVFVAYWLVAGPLGYAALKKAGLIRHAWVAFAAVAAAFTALAWTGAAAIHPSEEDARHVTILDHVYGQNAQRARSFLSVHTLQYGDATLAVGDPLLKGTNNFHNALAPFDTEATSAGGFPDSRGYRVDSKDPDQITFPSRSTVKQFQAEWAGGAWKMPRPVQQDGSAGQVRLTYGADGNPSISGTLVHDLPGPLIDATLVLVLGEKPISSTDGNRTQPPFLARGAAVSLRNAWGAGEPVDLSTQFADLPKLMRDKNLQLSGFLETLSEKQAIGGTDSGEVLDVSEGTFINRMMAMTFFQQAPPPDLNNPNGTGQRLLQRQNTHGMDLSAFFTQPCLIVVGVVQGPCPVPLSLSNGGAFRPATSKGFTIVRWVYPLAADPPPYTAPVNDPNTPLPGEQQPSDEGGNGV